MKMDKRTKARILAALKKHVDAIAKERDELHNLLSEYADVLMTCEEACEALESGIELLSQHT